MSASLPMPQQASGSRPLWRGAGLCCALALAAYAWRLLLSAQAGASLHIDEAQYWDWSTQLQWGYYSKPPAIAALIALSTRLFGDSETGLRALAMACYPATALVLSAWVSSVAAHWQPAPRAARAGVWACAIFLASPIAGLLGVVATTDGPLLLCWTVALASLWWAVVAQQRLAWVVLAVAAGTGLLSKYSFAAWMVGAALWVLVQPERRCRAAFALAMLTALAIWSPNLVWNHEAGWPTWRHTADITLSSSRQGGLLAAHATALPAFLLGQLLLLAPLLLPVLVWLRRRGPLAAMPPRLSSLLRWSSLPLLLMGVVQALRGGAQVNWIAPVHLAACVAMAWVLASASVQVRRLAGGALALQFLLISLLVAGPALAARSGSAWPAALDPWARMRGWQDAVASLGPVLRAHPDALVVGTTREVLAQLGYHARGLGLQRAAWQPGDGAARHHYALRCRWQPVAAGPRTVLLLSEGPPPALGDGMALQPLTQAAVHDLRGVRHTLWLSLLLTPAGAAADQPHC
jgi:4-amino-4-deoxy-L-arabinose transferase-like glycosyltransferase